MVFSVVLFSMESPCLLGSHLSRGCLCVNKIFIADAKANVLRNYGEANGQMFEAVKKVSAKF